MVQNNPKTDATIEQLSDFIAWKLFEKFSIDKNIGHGEYEGASISDIQDEIQNALILFTQEHPVRNSE